MRICSTFRHLIRNCPLQLFTNLMSEWISFCSHSWLILLYTWLQRETTRKLSLIFWIVIGWSLLINISWLMSRTLSHSCQMLSICLILIWLFKMISCFTSRWLTFHKLNTLNECIFQRRSCRSNINFSLKQFTKNGIIFVFLLYFNIACYFSSEPFSVLTLNKR